MIGVSEGCVICGVIVSRERGESEGVCESCVRGK